MDRSSLRPAPARARDGNRGGVLTSATIAVALVAAAWLLWVLESEVDASDFTRVETARVRLDAGATAVDPRWEALVRERLACIAPFASDDAGGQALVEQELRALPFVRSVGSAEVVWPDGLRVSLELRAPIACVKIGAEFWTIANDGMLLPGSWPAPPRYGPGWLPELALDAHELEGRAPGEILWSDAVADSLSVASSMWAELESEDLARLGRALIDARKARRASAEEPGTVIYLERSRRVLFGRAPSTHEPGELPAATKWLHVANSLLCLPAGPPLAEGGAPTARPGEVDWELVEVRWDHPAMLPRGGAAGARIPVVPVKTAKPKAPTAEPKPGARQSRVH